MTTSTESLVAVSEAAREAAADFARDFMGWPEHMVTSTRKGRHDDKRPVQAFARFEARLQSPPAASQDCAGMREALAPFAAVADEYDDRESDDFEVWKDAGPVRTIRATFKLGMYRKARAALNQGELQQGSVGEGADDALRQSLETARVPSTGATRHLFPNGRPMTVEEMRRYMKRAAKALAADNGQGLREALDRKLLEDVRDYLFQGWFGNMGGGSARNDLRTRIDAALSGSIEGKGDGEA